MTFGTFYEERHILPLSFVNDMKPLPVSLLPNMTNVDALPEILLNVHAIVVIEVEQLHPDDLHVFFSFLQCKNPFFY